ncbi:hypothetical protein SSX86_029527 [Deinandra increscens subsp. villosa]|uniref:non-specific serine/threonine protein kinase n=1 Tax=Deinandra increscens subsp. villosa TaxID=3103831 RepID=A0AAP0CFT3_9ASTR
MRMCKILPQILPFFFFFSIALPQSTNSSYPNCPSYNCSDITISYPFWRLDRESASQFCGYEGFGINCSAFNGTDLPSINLGGAPYHVQEINYESSIVSLVDYDVSNVIHVPNDCPRVRHGISLGTLPFSFTSSNVNISFHFNCTGYPSFANAIPCLYDNESRASVNVVDSEMEKFDWSVYSCDEEVVTAVLREAVVVAGSDQGLDYVNGLRRGFELNWRALEECRKCEESKGRCGRNYNSSELTCFCSDGTSQCYRYKVIGVGAALLTIVAICITCYVKRISLYTYISSIRHKCEDHMSVEAFIKQYGSLTTNRYSYAEIKKMTNSFQVKLGGGGFGTVFRGELSDGHPVAVKLLNPSRASGKEFINEVASIGRISHVNIVSLLGFCSDNHRRALVYEFMPNGSLEKYIPKRDPRKPSVQLDVKKLYEVAVGIARDASRIADFGLAKLYSREESVVSMLEARGTIGYIAPEIFNRSIGGVSHKSDIYSYGMLLLEMVGATENLDVGVGSKSTSDSYFPNWIYSRLEKEEYVFDGISSSEESEYVRKMTIVGLWCIQTVPSQRPSIDEVIEMLEGSTGALRVPKRPSFSSYHIQAPVTTCSTSQSEQEGSDLKNSFCLDGSPPAYQFDAGFGDGVNNWLVHMQGGGWCNSVNDCHTRTYSQYGSSKKMKSTDYNFTGILSNKQELNPGFYNWNRVAMRYCDGSSFTGDIEAVDPATNLHFRGARVFNVIIEELLGKGMKSATNALLSGSSAGGLASILHCDKFKAFFPSSSRVKCFSDAGYFAHVKDLSGEYKFEGYYDQVVTLHGSSKNLYRECTTKMKPSLCFYPQFAIPYVQTPIFILHSTYDTFQVQNIFATPQADPSGLFAKCKQDISACSSDQIQKLQEAVGDWFYDRNPAVQLVDNQNVLPHYCIK